MFRILILNVVMLSLCAVTCAETHVVTITRDHWYYRDARSGKGESRAVRIEVRAGDIVRFRQTIGEHGTIIYRSKKSGIGRSIDIEQGFEIVSGTLTDRLSTGRLFRHENRTTPLYEGLAEHLAIRIEPNFRDPIYFADRSTIRGTGERAYGVITAATGPKVEQVMPLDFSLQSAKNVMDFQPSAWNENRNLGNISGVPRKSFLVPKDSKSALENNWGDWFQSRLVAPLHLSPFEPEVRWEYATSMDVDRDQDLDVLALIFRGNADSDRRAWWLFVNGTKPNRQHPGDASDLLGATRRFTSALKLVAVPEREIAGDLFAGVADFDGDDRDDVFLYSGISNEVTFLYQTPSLTVPGYEFSRAHSIDTEIVMDISPPRGGYPSDENEDGFSDLVVLGREQSAAFINRPGRGFSSTDATAVQIRAESLSRIGLDDLNGDHRLEIVVETSDGEFRAFSKSRDGAYQITNSENEK